MIGIVLFVVGDELSSMLMFCDEMVLNEADETIGMRLLLEMEIKSISHLNDVESLLMCIVLKNELL